MQAKEIYLLNSNDFTEKDIMIASLIFQESDQSTQKNERNIDNFGATEPHDNPVILKPTSSVPEYRCIESPVHFAALVTTPTIVRSLILGQRRRKQHATIFTITLMKVF